MFGYSHIHRRLDRIERKLEIIMATLDQVIQDVQDETTAIDSVSELIVGLKQQLADALSGVTVPPAVQAKIDAVFTGLEANKAKLATALATGPTGTPVTPAPTPTP